jgi:hypothetical protein
MLGIGCFALAVLAPTSRAGSVTFGDLALGETNAFPFQVSILILLRQHAINRFTLIRNLAPGCLQSVQSRFSTVQFHRIWPTEPTSFRCPPRLPQ